MSRSIPAGWKRRVAIDLDFFLLSKRNNLRAYDTIRRPEMRAACCPKPQTLSSTDSRAGLDRHTISVNYMPRSHIVCLTEAGNGVIAPESPRRTEEVLLTSINGGLILQDAPH